MEAKSECKLNLQELLCFSCYKHSSLDLCKGWNEMWQGFSLRPSVNESGAFSWGYQSADKWKFMVCQLITLFVLSLLLVGTSPTFICSVPICRTCSNGANTYVWNAPIICSCVSIYCSTYSSGTAHSVSPAFWTGAEAGEYRSVWYVLRQPCVVESFIQLLIIYQL